MKYLQTILLVAAALRCSQAHKSNTAGNLFIYSHCYCENGFITYDLKVRFPNSDGSLTQLSVQPEACEKGWTTDDQCDYENKCADTEVCGVGELCYNKELFDSDEFSIDGANFKKNDYDNNCDDITGSKMCHELCEGIGSRACDPAGNYACERVSYSWTVARFERPQVCDW